MCWQVFMSNLINMPKKQIPEHQRRRLEEISLFIKNWRIFEGLSQGDFSNLAEVHVNTLQKFENHKTNNISVLTLFSLIDAMDGMTLSDFFTGIE
jgi:transcriptional regulator with XRE-family HTH domain